MDVTALPSHGVLDRADGRAWSAVLEPILRDTHGVEKSKLRLHLIDSLISQLVDELKRHRLPEFVIYTAPDRRDVTRLAFLSALVAHRAERLVQVAMTV
ncbi:hypothetical protein MKCMC460_16510 [Mycobacterium sp. 20KCMC460]|nr:hypothetical protein MKCMC460_16510 [Mycobacterium sp. 20KCMC460]